MDELKYIIECLLFVSETPLTLDKLKKILETPEIKDIREALDSLCLEYEARPGGITLREVAGGFQIRTRPEYARWIKRLIQPGAQRLSKPALETLAIIAYKQPIIRADIEYIRGVDCGGVLRMLLEKKLVRVLGRKEIPGRPMIYATTRQFLELFDLKDLKDLPSPKEIEALGHTNELDIEPEISDIETDISFPAMTGVNDRTASEPDETSEIKPPEETHDTTGPVEDSHADEDRSDADENDPTEEK